MGLIRATILERDDISAPLFAQMRPEDMTCTRLSDGDEAYDLYIIHTIHQGKCAVMVGRVVNSTALWLVSDGTEEPRALKAECSSIVHWMEHIGVKECYLVNVDD
jgi:hypothetical protein